MSDKEGVSISVSVAEDREMIGEVTRRTGVFDETECKTVFELFDTFIKDPAYGYFFLSAYWNGALAGYACFGPTALTEGAFDFYWLSTDPSVQRKGIGQALCLAVMEEARKRNGRLIVIWTSSTPGYEPATKLYVKLGYEPSGRIRDFYKPGDDLLVFVKYL
jgi:GNAT superfamily N-acetyltransferase